MTIDMNRWNKYGVVFALIALLALTFAAGPSAAAQGASAPDFAAIDHYIEQEMAALRLPGLALGIVQGDQIVHLKGFGTAGAQDQPVTPQTPFVIESLSKSFTALAIMQLVEAGKLDLDAPVQRYLPWFRVADPESSARMTVRHLLHQTSGLSQLTGNIYSVHGDVSDTALEHAVRGIATTRTRPLGQGFEYSNMNYTILGLIVQTVSGQPYEHYIQQQIIAPLAMEHSYAALADARRNGVASGYRFWFGQPRRVPADEPYNRAAAPEGLISASAEDMSHYLIAQLNGGHYAGARLLSPAGIATLHRPEATTTFSSTYAMGWIAEESDGLATVWHNGAGVEEGFQSHMILVPEGRWGIVVLTNGINFLNFERIDGIADKVLSLLLDRPLPPGSLDLFRTLFLGFLAIGALQLLGIAYSVVLLRRWRAEPARRPQGSLGMLGQVWLPFVLNLIWFGLVLRFFVEGLTAEHLMLLTNNDFGWVVLTSGSIALVWGLLRLALASAVLRTPAAPKAVPAQLGA